MEDDVLLLTQICDSVFDYRRQSAFAINIPSLGGDQTLLFSAGQVTSSLRKETLAWSCLLPAPVLRGQYHLQRRGQKGASDSDDDSDDGEGMISLEQQQQQREQRVEANLLHQRSSRNVFWSLVAAHTAGYEARHHNGTSLCAWLIPAVACRIINKFVLSRHHSNQATQSQLVACLRIVQEQFQKSLSTAADAACAAAMRKPSTSMIRVENIAPLSSRWIAFAESAIRQCGVLSSCLRCSAIDGGDNDDVKLLATVVVQALLAVCVPGKGIYVDRIKVHVDSGAVPSTTECDQQDSTSSSSSSSSSSSESSDDNDGGSASSAPPLVAELLRGMRLPPVSVPGLGLESQVVLKRILHKNKNNKKYSNNNNSDDNNADDEDEGSQHRFGTTRMPRQTTTALALFVSCSILESDLERVRHVVSMLTSSTSSPLPIVLICQRVVAPAVKICLASDLPRCQVGKNSCSSFVVCVDRLGIQHFPVLLQLLNVASPLHELSSFSAVGCSDGNTMSGRGAHHDPLLLLLLIAAASSPCLLSQSARFSSFWLAPTSTPSRSVAASLSSQPPLPPSIHTILLRISPLTFVSSAASVDHALRCCLKNVALLFANGACLVAARASSSERQLLEKVVDTVFVVPNSTTRRQAQQQLLCADIADAIVSLFRNVATVVEEEEEEKDERESDETTGICCMLRLPAVNDAFATALELAISLVRIEHVA